MFGRIFFFFPLNSQAAQQNESLSFGTQILQSGRGTERQCLLCNQQPECRLRELVNTDCSHPLSNHWTSYSRWQGGGDLKTQRNRFCSHVTPLVLVSFTGHCLPLTLTSFCTERAKEEAVLTSPGTSTTSQEE